MFCHRYWDCQSCSPSSPLRPVSHLSQDHLRSHQLVLTEVTPYSLRNSRRKYDGGPSFKVIRCTIGPQSSQTIFAALAAHMPEGSGLPNSSRKFSWCDGTCGFAETLHSTKATQPHTNALQALW